MFFKRLEIQGFKSFAAKTTIDFQSGITVIVGPNGCGKSNIFDSLRWVLGEQNPRELRGGRMADVIFSGSSSFKAQGVAQVALVVDNAERNLPIDFSEIQITRRLYGDGQSEYQLNKTPCRLRDITELFLDTGVGHHGYSIMEQGKVDGLINAKPLERRIIFEEAAGIAKYRARRGEALRKLERAEADFLRLTDLIAEVRRQCNSLKRQASKAERYKLYKEEARGVERRLLALRFEQLRARLKEISHEHDTQQDRLTALATKIVELEAGQEGVRETQAEANAEISALRERKYEIDGEVERRNNAITLLRERIGESERRIGLLSREAEVDSREEFSVAHELGMARRELEDAGKRRAESREFYADQKQEFDEIRGGREEVAGQLAALRDSLHQLRERKSAADNAVNISRMLIQRLDEQIESGDRQNAALRDTLKNLKERAEALQREGEESVEAFNRAGAELETLGRAAEEVDKEHEALRVETARLERELGQVQSKLKALEDLEASYNGYYLGVRSVMQARDEGRLEGLVGVVAQLIVPPAEFETAIEAALGGHVQDIVARTADNARRAVDFLKAEGKGRATFQPLDLLEVREPHSSFERALGLPGVIGAAGRLVQYDPSIETAVRFLLGSTAIVESLDRAIQLEREGLRNRYVSLDGQIVAPQGSISGGAVKSSGLMGREREIRELRESAGELERVLETRRARMDQLREISQAARQEERVLRDQRQSLQVRLAELAKESDACRSTLEEKQGAFSEYETKRQQWLDETTVHRDAIYEKEAQALECQTQIEEIEESLRRAQSDMELQDTQVDALAGSLSELRVEIASYDERIDRLHSRCERMNKRLHTLSAAQARRQAEARALHRRNAEAEEEIAGIRQSMGEFFEQRRATETSIAESEQSLEALRQALGEKTQALRQLESQRNEMQNETHESDLRRTEIEVQLSQTREQALERFQCGIEQLAGEVAAAPQEGEEAAPPLSADELFGRLQELNESINAMGLVNLTALEEYEEQSSRLEFLTAQESDLTEARRQLTEAIASIDETTKQMFSEAFNVIKENFSEMFRRLFGGGRAELRLTEVEGGDPLLDGGIDIVAQPPGKKLQNISLLSGGEKALTAISLLFGIFMHRPSPFCILDEIDAPLDDQNIGRFKNLLLEFAQRTQFIIITHNKQTMTLADTIYGVTMEEAGVSKLVSVRFDESLSMAG